MIKLNSTVITLARAFTETPFFASELRNLFVIGKIV